MERNIIKEYYANEIERNRLKLDLYKLEGVRSKEIISRYLSQNSLRIIDIGGYMCKVQKIIDMVETNDDLISMSPHIMAIAKKL